MQYIAVSACISYLHFTSLCSIHPAWFSEYEGKNSLLTDAFSKKRKSYDKTKIFQQAKI